MGIAVGPGYMKEIDSIFYVVEVVAGSRVSAGFDDAVFQIRITRQWRWLPLP
jgi:hypothetical protein